MVQIGRFMGLVNRFAERFGKTTRYFVISSASNQRFMLADETFYRQVHHWLAEQLKPDTTIIDIGANIGDTAIYFAQFEKVKKVVAYEPLPYAYRLAERYVSQSGLSEKIELRNMAISSSRGDIYMPDMVHDAGFNIHSKSGKVKIKKILLSDALNGLESVAIKSDCEGEERWLFNDTDLSNVYAAIIEWHGDAARDAAREAFIREGFILKTSNEGYSKRYGSIGHLHAQRKD